jgi:hypothetical protein
MSDASHDRIDAFFRQPDLVAAAVQRGVQRALWRHKCLGESIVVWRNGAIVTIPAAEIEVTEPQPMPPPAASPKAP